MSLSDLRLPGIHGRVVIVTGHKNGIGAAAAKLLAGQGARVHGFDLPEVDLADPAAIERAVGAVAKTEGHVDILINNAGVTVMGDVTEVTLEELDRVLAVNLRAPILLMKAVIPYMKKQPRGVIVNNASDQAFVGKRYSAIYGASKAAVAQLSKSAALDWAPYGIRVNCVAPGSTDTPMLRQVFAQLHERYPSVYPADGEEFYKSGIPQHRFAHPEEIAVAMLFLASDAASFITGTVLPVDGGFVAQ